MPKNMSVLLKGFKHILVPEMNMGQFKTVLRDHANRPHSICAHPGERVSYSFASIISDLEAGHMEVAVGPPCEHDYVRYEVGA